MSPPEENRLQARSSIRSSYRMSTTHDDDGDYDLDAMAVSDGFRPSDGPHDNPTQIADRVVSQRQSIVNNTLPPQRPSSIMKPKFAADSFALRHDGAMGPLSSMAAADAAQSSTSNMAAVRRSISNTSDAPIARPESPYTGPTQPSHAYHMYPQNPRPSRTMSMATDSTVQVPERSYSGPTGPTHPYGMYPQNTIEPEPEQAVAQAAIPVGFPGMQNNYQRRLGPEGEEAADLIGPDGHTEQLPPYTRYPDEGLGGKAVTAAAIGAGAVVIPAAHSSEAGNVSPTMSGAGGIGLATRDPAFSSRDDLSVPNSRHSTRSLMSDGSNHQINTAAAIASEKAQPPQKTWQKIAARKICGIIPLWAMILAAVCCFCMGIILGAVLAVLGPGHHSDHKDPYGSSSNPYGESTMTTTFDASALTATPTDLPPLPTGEFALALSNPYTTDSSCIGDSNDIQAWSCNVPPSSLEMTVTYSQTSDGVENEITFGPSNYSVPGTLLYGSQPPVVNPERVMELVEDLQSSDWGPAWFFQIAYDKLVIAGESQISTQSRKRASVLDFSRKGVVQNGDKPWFCYWNGTLLESFIYVNKTSSAASQSSGSSGSQTTATTAATAAASNGAQRRDQSTSPTSTITSMSGASQTATSTSSTETMIESLMSYPKVMKVEERRVPDASQSLQPYCIQMVVQGDGSVLPLDDGTGHPVTVMINETTQGSSESKRSAPADLTSHQEWIKRKIFERGSPVQERQSSPTCSCVWLSS